ncbi:hypothetical protein C7S16_1097 [Burkholderia thailandensis]|uniref:Uncharacterized protein n=1 Tax=Burkholderia thailandensis TaxID=57975 RepID=A0AAW9D6Y8_BURTH|nr:hypothetical protein [Burkholderia thailandensis]MDW9257654.1 hypothetical protein [Burkholderia thailandensis]
MNECRCVGRMTKDGCRRHPFFCWCGFADGGCRCRGAVAPGGGAVSGGTGKGGCAIATTCV